MNNMFENRVLRKMFGHWGDEVLGCCRKFRIEEFLDFWCSTSSVNVVIISRHLELVGKTTRAYTFLIGNPEGKRPLGRPMLRWEDNCKLGIISRIASAKSRSYGMWFLYIGFDLIGVQIKSQEHLITKATNVR
jgi:hypothetical protein